MPRKKLKISDPLSLTAQYRPGWIDDSDKRRGDYKAIVSAREALTNDLGGLQNLSVQKQMIVDRAVFLCLRLATLERLVLRGEDIEWSHYGFLANSLTGHLKTLGLERQIKNMGSLKDYIEAGS